MTIPKVIKEHFKTIVAFIATFVGNAVVSLINGSTAWPQTKDEWVQYALTSVGAAFSVYLAQNKISDKQVDKDPTVVRVDPPVVATGPTPWVP